MRPKFVLLEYWWWRAIAICQANSKCYGKYATISNALLLLNSIGHLVGQSFFTATEQSFKHCFGATINIVIQSIINYNFPTGTVLGGYCDPMSSALNMNNLNVIRHPGIKRQQCG